MLALVGLASRRVTVVALENRRPVEVAEASLEPGLGSPIAVALTSERLHLLTNQGEAESLVTFRLGGGGLVRVASRSLPSDAGALAAARDGTLWVGLSRGAIARADGEIGPGDPRDLPSPCDLSLSPNGRSGVLVTTVSLGDSGSTGLYAGPLRGRAAVALLRERLGDDTRSVCGAGVTGDGRVWCVDGRGHLGLSRVDAPAKRPAWSGLGGFRAVAGASLAKGGLVLGDEAGRVAFGELRGRSWRPRAALVRTSVGLDSQSRLSGLPNGDVLVLATGTGVAEIIPEPAHGARSRRLLDLKEPILAAVRAGS